MYEAGTPLLLAGFTVTIEVSAGLHGTDEAPGERARGNPPTNGIGVDGVTGGSAIGREEIIERGDAAHFAVATEAPRPYAEPAQILQWIAEVGQLPANAALSSAIQ